MITYLPLDKNNRMLRNGIGKNEGRWFGRIDFWWFGLRFTGWALLVYTVPHLAFLGWLLMN
jgi:hypothetical protein